MKIDRKKRQLGKRNKEKDVESKTARQIKNAQGWANEKRRHDLCELP